MNTKIALCALGLACVVAAGSGAYLASRHNADDLAIRTVAGTVPASDAVAPKPAPTAETEAVIDENKAKTPVAAPIAEAPDPTIVAAPTLSPANRPARNNRTAAAPPRATATTPGSRGPVSAPIAAAPAADQRPATPITPDPEPVARPSEPVPTPAETAPPPPPAKEFDELVVTADSVIGLQIESTITSEKARIEDRVDARVTRDVKVGDRVAIPAGSRVEGSVTQVERGGKIRERARLGIRFHTLVLADGSRVPLSTTTLFRDGDPPARQSASKIGGAAVGGAILGAILGGGKGAAAGAAAGAAGGTAAVMAGDRNAATLAAGSTVTVRVVAPVTITVERSEQQ